MDGCIACDLASGALALPGGRILETPRWLVEHCVGPLGLGTMIVKPKRHVLHVWELDRAEAEELGPLLRRTAAALARILEPEQVYVSLWSHAGGSPVHIHWVVQPISRAQVAETGSYGPRLQAEMFEHGEPPRADAIEAIAAQLRAELALDRA
ncbi:MAG: HIT family protein [Gaiellaceae bacterium]